LLAASPIPVFFCFLEISVVVAIENTYSTLALQHDGRKQILYPKSNHKSWLRTICIVEGRALDKFSLPWLLVTLNAVLWVVLVEFVLPPHFLIHVEDFGSYETYFALVLNSSLAFLLVFRLNRSAERFWQARASWGMIVAVSRTMVSGVLMHATALSIQREQERQRRWRRGQRKRNQPTNNNSHQHPTTAYTTDTASTTATTTTTTPTLTTTPNVEYHRDEVIRWIAAFSVSSMHFIRGLSELAPDTLRGILRQDQLQALEAQPHGPLFAADQIRWHLKELFRMDSYGNDYQEDDEEEEENEEDRHHPAHVLIAEHFAAIQHLDTLEVQVNELVKEIGALERIRATPLPLVYVSHLRTFLLCFLIATPYVWQSTLGYSTIPIVALTAFALLGLEGAAQEVESPFQRHRTNHLDMDSFCLGLLSNILQQLRTSADREMQQRPQQQQSKKQNAKASTTHYAVAIAESSYA
jgi:predicted membrane chloride channel (bestrophin family)